jgi:hypothetical protein
LFDPEAVRKLGPVEALGKEPRERDHVAVLCGLGRAIVLAYEDRADESNAEFLKVVTTFPPPPKKDVVPKAKDLRRGVLEQFFARSVPGANWKRAVGEALDRNEKNLGGKLPDELKRLRMLPAKGVRG